MSTTDIYTLSLHDALPISSLDYPLVDGCKVLHVLLEPVGGLTEDRKSTRLNSSHTVISYAVFCLKKKNKQMSNRIKLLEDTLFYRMQGFNIDNAAIYIDGY